ncbi:hypothetical protein AB4254_08700, partial [Vibrio breoganii]
MSNNDESQPIPMEWEEMTSRAYPNAEENPEFSDEGVFTQEPENPSQDSPIQYESETLVEPTGEPEPPTEDILNTLPEVEPE